MGDEQFIVSKTDLRGHIIYANRTFMEMSALSEDKLLNINHNIIRHPDMPKGVFKFIWMTIKKEKEFFGFVKNLRSDGRYYWVFANITPEYDVNGKLSGYLSVRRKPPISALDVIEPIYETMLEIEASASSNKIAEDNSIDYLQKQLKNLNVEYQDFVIGLFNSQ
ncbi:PAS domain-containing protein [Colwellia sp. KU-HH00111]